MLTLLCPVKVQAGLCWVQSKCRSAPQAVGLNPALALALGSTCLASSPSIVPWLSSLPLAGHRAKGRSGPRVRGLRDRKGTGTVCTQVQAGLEPPATPDVGWRDVPRSALSLPHTGPVHSDLVQPLLPLKMPLGNSELWSPETDLTLPHNTDLHFRRGN
jgi:hypothetical protein